MKANDNDQEPFERDDAEGDDPFESRRPRRKKRRKILGLWARLSLLGLVCAVVAVAIVGIVGKIAKPYRQVVALQGQLDSVRSELSRTNAENADYQRRITYINTPEGVATEARQYGYVKPHEIPVVVADSKPIWSPPAPLTESAPPPTFSERVRHLWNSIWGRR